MIELNNTQASILSFFHHHWLAADVRVVVVIVAAASVAIFSGPWHGLSNRGAPVESSWSESPTPTTSSVP